MRTIEDHKQIDQLLRMVDEHATKAINEGKKFTVEWRDNGITEKQFKGLHVWFRHCCTYLNDRGLYRLSPVSGKKIPSTEKAFKNDVYKVILAALTKKQSTKYQSTIEPNDIVMAISGHMATAWSTSVQLPPWPSNR